MYSRNVAKQSSSTSRSGRANSRIPRAPVFLHLREDKKPAEVKPQAVIPASNIEDHKCEESRSANLEVDSIIQQLSKPAETMELEAAGAHVKVTSLNKTLWPASGKLRPLTKRDLLVYYAKCSPVLLSHLRGRPLTFARYPDGITGQHFLQRHWQHKLPDFVETINIYSEDNKSDREFIVCNNLPTLIWLGQIADIELHSWFSRDDPQPDGKDLSREFSGSLENIESSMLNYPDYMVFDLDPYIYSGKESEGAEPEFNAAAFKKVCEVALALKATLEGLGLQPFVKTSGKTGLHIYVPVTRKYSFDAIRGACEMIGRFLMLKHPNDVTMDWSTAKRRGKIFLDHNMNARSKTISSVYSPRANAGACVSMPLRWEEVGKIDPCDLTILTAPKRLDELGDLWAGTLDAKRELSKFATSSIS